jgi:hypothetical protein
MPDKTRRHRTHCCAYVRCCAGRRDFVLQNDPVPRALLSVDPTFQALKQWSPVRGLLALRGALLGEGSPLSSSRFLFEAVGDVYLIKWEPSGGTQVRARERLNPRPWNPVCIVGCHVVPCGAPGSPCGSHVNPHVIAM